MRFSHSSGTRPLPGYTIKRGIGVGGFGEVYFALNDAGKEVALKKIQRNLDIELRGVGYCLNLKHVNLISLWDIQSNEFGESWVVMEYVPGPSLRDVVEMHQQGMPEDQVKQWFASTAAGVAYLHEHGIVHRDLKPGNIFCDQDEQVIKIGDYGLSKFISCSRRSGQTEAVGTFHYMAPEIGKGEYGKEIDVYAMGIILYEMLTGEVPFDGESTQEIIMKHLTLDVDLASLDRSYHRVIDKALRKDPQKRYSSVGEMVADLPWPDISSQRRGIINRNAVGQIPLPPVNRVQPKSTAGYQDDEPLTVLTEPTTPKAMLPPPILTSQTVSAVAATEDTLLVHTGSIVGGPLNAGGFEKDDEPMAVAVRSGLHDINQWWNQANVSTPVRLGLMIVTGIVVIQNSTWLLAVFFAMASIYLLYYAARRYVLSLTTNDASLKSVLNQQHQRCLSWREKLAQRPLSDQLTELTGSLLIGGISAIVFSFFALALGLETANQSVAGPAGTLTGWAIFTWQTLWALVAVMTALVVAKQWTWTRREFWSRAGTMLLTGALIGGAAFYSSASFEIDLARIAADDFSAKQTAVWVVGGIAKLPAMIICMAVLVGLVPLAHLTDPLRRTRLSVMNVFLFLIVAIVSSHLLALPLTVLCSVAVVVSISTQLASPWYSQKFEDGTDFPVQ